MSLNNKPTTSNSILNHKVVAPKVLAQSGTSKLNVSSFSSRGKLLTGNLNKIATTAPVPVATNLRVSLSSPPIKSKSAGSNRSTNEYGLSTTSSISKTVPGAAVGLKSMIGHRSVAELTELNGHNHPSSSGFAARSLPMPGSMGRTTGASGSAVASAARPSILVGSSTTVLSCGSNNAMPGSGPGSATLKGTTVQTVSRGATASVVASASAPVVAKRDGVESSSSTSVAALAALRPKNVDPSPLISTGLDSTTTGSANGGANNATIMSHIARLRALTAPVTVSGPVAREIEAAAAISSNFQKKNMKNNLGACKGLQKSSYSRRKDLAAYRREQNGSIGNASMESLLNSNSHVNSNNSGNSGDSSNGNATTSEYFDYVSEARASVPRSGSDESTVASDSLSTSHSNPHVYHGGYNTNSGRAQNKFNKYKSKFGGGSNSKYGQHSSGNMDKFKNKPGADNSSSMGGVFYGIDSLSFSLDHFTNNITSSTAAVTTRVISDSAKLAPPTSYFGDNLKSKTTAVKSVLGSKSKQCNSIFESNADDSVLIKCAPECMEHHMPSKLLVVKKSGPNKGRKFYRCGVFPMEQSCDFFMWADDNPLLLEYQQTNPAAATASTGDSDNNVGDNSSNGLTLASAEYISNALVLYTEKLKNSCTVAELKAEMQLWNRKRALLTAAIEQNKEERDDFIRNQSLKATATTAVGSVPPFAPLAGPATGEVSEQERVRLENIQRNAAFLLSMGLAVTPSNHPANVSGGSSGLSASSVGEKRKRGAAGDGIELHSDTDTVPQCPEELLPWWDPCVSSRLTVTGGARPALITALVAEATSYLHWRFGAEGMDSDTASSASTPTCYLSTTAVVTVAPEINTSGSSSSTERNCGGGKEEYYHCSNDDDDDDDDDDDGIYLSDSDLDSDCSVVSIVAVDDADPEVVPIHPADSVSTVSSPVQSVVSQTTTRTDPGYITRRRQRCRYQSEFNASNFDTGHSPCPDVVSNKKADAVHNVLRYVFGCSSFREGQRWAVDRVLAGQKSLLVLPTGTGKSLCYMLPSVVLPGLTIVVTPLISLMKDQLKKLPVDLPGVCLSGGGGALTTFNITQMVSKIIKGGIKVLYVSPEKLCSSGFRRLIRILQSTAATHHNITAASSGVRNDSNGFRSLAGSSPQHNPISLLCIDEVHCVSQWSYNFRSSYLRLCNEISTLNPHSLLCLTATATKSVQSEIMSLLDIPSNGVWATSPYRSNLQLTSMLVSGDDSAKRQVLVRWLKYGNLHHDRCLTDSESESDSSDISDCESDNRNGNDNCDDENIAAVDSSRKQEEERESNDMIALSSDENSDSDGDSDTATAAKKKQRVIHRKSNTCSQMTKVHARSAKTKPGIADKPTAKARTVTKSKPKTIGGGGSCDSDKNSGKRGSTVIYTWRRDEADTLLEYLKAVNIQPCRRRRRRGIIDGGGNYGNDDDDDGDGGNGKKSSSTDSIVCYHAGMSAEQRERAQNSFIRGTATIIIATVAFGMGIDKSDIRQVIHLTIPKSLENYLQEVGRAGRDGAKAKCLMLYSTQDYHMHSSLTYSSHVSILQIRGLITSIFRYHCNANDKCRNGISTRSTDAGVAPAHAASAHFISILEPRVCIDTSKLETSLDISAPTIETILTMLELFKPQALIKVHDPHSDLITGTLHLSKLKLSMSTDGSGTGEILTLPLPLQRLIRAIVACNRLSNATTTTSTTTRTTSSDLDDSRWSDWVLSTLSNASGSGVATHSSGTYGSDYSSYTASKLFKLEFNCSVFELALQCSNYATSTGNSSNSTTDMVGCDDILKSLYQLMNYHKYNYVGGISTNNNGTNSIANNSYGTTGGGKDNRHQLLIYTLGTSQLRSISLCSSLLNATKRLVMYGQQDTMATTQTQNANNITDSNNHSDVNLERYLRFITALSMQIYDQIYCIDTTSEARLAQMLHFCKMIGVRSPPNSGDMTAGGTAGSNSWFSGGSSMISKQSQPSSSIIVLSRKERRRECKQLLQTYFNIAVELPAQAQLASRYLEALSYLTDSNSSTVPELATVSMLPTSCTDTDNRSKSDDNSPADVALGAITSISAAVLSAIRADCVMLSRNPTFIESVQSVHQRILLLLENALESVQRTPDSVNSIVTGTVSKGYTRHTSVMQVDRTETYAMYTIFICRILHGLASSSSGSILETKTAQFVYSDYWGKYKHLSFKDLLNAVSDITPRCCADI